MVEQEVQVNNTLQSWVIIQLLFTTLFIYMLMSIFSVAAAAFTYSDINI